jgi:hypothetical protein
MMSTDLVIEPARPIQVFEELGVPLPAPQVQTRDLEVAPDYIPAHTRYAVRSFVV